MQGISIMTYQRQWVERNDNVPGWVYLMEAEGYHGLIPGCFLRRVKIGLSRNPQKRLDDFHSNQPPCNIRIIRTIFVEDMKKVEDELHEQFKHSSVTLHRSREWFDLDPLQFWQVQQAFNRYEKPRFSFALNLPSRLVVASTIGLLGASLLLHSASSSLTPVKVIPTAQSETLIQSKVLQKNKYTTGRKNFAS